MRAYLEVLRTPHAWPFSAAGVIARFPHAMLGISMTLMIQGIYGRYAIAGMVSAVFTISMAVGAPLVARLIDTLGQRIVGRALIVFGSLSLAALVALTLLRVPPVLLCLPAIGVGVTSLPVAAMCRARWSYLLRDKPWMVTRAFSWESVIDDVSFVLAPSIGTALATAVHPIGGVVCVIVLLIGGGSIFLAQRASEPLTARQEAEAAQAGESTPSSARVDLVASGDPDLAATTLADGGSIATNSPAAPSDEAGSSASPGANADATPRGATAPATGGRLVILNPAVALVCCVLFSAGLIFGANNLSVVAFCELHGMKWFSSILLGVGSLASMTGALLYGAYSWRIPLWKRFLIFVLCFAFFGMLFPLSNSVLVLFIINFFFGATVSPTFINGNMIVQQIVPPHQLTEGLTWIGTMVNVGMSVGSLVAGSLIDQFGAHAGFYVVAAAGLLGGVTVLCATPTLRKALPEDASVLR
ncbi:MAG: MFS transporter [Propionibacteriaceae bacterium]|jgi:MFS family permease|nr:MFS transporter [Propionibacteriaceae bacterium]